jgi:hypothetical protein
VEIKMAWRVEYIRLNGERKVNIEMVYIDVNGRVFFQRKIKAVR